MNHGVPADTRTSQMDVGVPLASPGGSLVSSVARMSSMGSMPVAHRVAGVGSFRGS
jgi:hypothetical protein